MGVRTPADSPHARRRQGVAVPVLLDDVDDAVASAYGGWPDRIYLIGRDGRVAFQGEDGPFGLGPEELAHAIEGEQA